MLVEGNLAWHTSYGTFRTLRAAYRRRPESVVVRSTEFLFPWEGTLDRALDLRNPLYLTRTTRQQFCAQVRRTNGGVIFTEIFEWVSGLTGRPHVRGTSEMDELSQQYATRLAELVAQRDEALKALNLIDALDPEEHVYGCSADALRGIVIQMGQIARRVREGGKVDG